MVFVAVSRYRFLRYLRSIGPLPKVAAALWIGVTVAAARSFVALAPAAVLLVLGAVWLPGGIKRVLLGLAGVVTFAATAFFLGLWSAGPPPEFNADSVLTAALIATKVILLAALSAFVARITSPAELGRAAYELTKPLHALKCNSESAALAITFGLVTLPALARAYRDAWDAVKIRTAAPFPRRFRFIPAIFLATFREAETRAHIMAETLFLRGCHTPAGWFAYTADRRSSRGAIFLAVAFTVGAISLVGTLVWPRG